MTDETRNPTVPEPEPASQHALLPASPPASPPALLPASPPALAPALLPASPPSGRPASSADVRARRPEYRGEELDPERGPGLGCFWFQVIVLGFFFVLIPIGLNLNWPFELLAILLFVVLGLLLLTGQTVIFLLRLVAADRRAQGRRRPLASPTKTVGELEDAHRVAHAVGGARPVAEPAADRTAGRGEAAAPPAPADSAEADSDADPADGVFVASEAMIRDDEVLGAPVVGAHDTESEAGPVADSDATDTDEATRAPAPTTEGDAAAPGDRAGGGEGQMAARMHESSPDGQGLGPAAADEAGSPAADDAGSPAADDIVPGTDPARGELPEDPYPSVRQ